MPLRRTPAADQYYWLTAYLAARDMQGTVSRTVALIIVTLGATPPVLASSPAGAQGLPGFLVAASVTVCCVAMGALWWRRSWPTQAQARLCVVLGSVCIAAACLIAAHPVVGLLGTSTFVVPSALGALFHSARLLGVTWAIGAVTVTILGIRLAGTDTTLALCGIGTVVTISVFSGVAARLALHLHDGDHVVGDLEPLTGLLTRGGFEERVAQLIGARSRRDDGHLVVAVVNLDSFSLLSSLHGAIGTDRARVAVAQRLRETARGDAVLAHVGDAEYLVADVFTTPDPTVLAERVGGAIRTVPFRLTASIGAVSTPLPPLAPHPAPDVLDEVLAVAEQAMRDARTAGGNQHRVILDPRLKVLNNPTEDDKATDRPAEPPRGA